MNSRNPRRAAFEILLRVEQQGSHADTLLHRELSKGALEGPDRRLLTELVYGVLRRRESLDYVLNLFSSQKTNKLENKVLTLLRLGLYQCLFLDRIPVSAAVNETVNLAKMSAPRAAGFINAVLRTADRERESIVWPDKGESPVEYLRVFYSHPKWLVEDWIRQLGLEEAETLARVMAEPALLTFRANTLRISAEALLVRLHEEDVHAEMCRYSPHGIRVTSHVNPSELSAFSQGLFTVQDESSQLASFFLAPEPGDVVLDACAAPGGKSTHIAQIMGDRGCVFACDSQKGKLQLITDTARRLGLSNIRTVPLDVAGPLESLDVQLFDRILVDAPCSGLGVLRRNPEAKWHKTRSDLLRLAALQKRILTNLAGRLKTGGILLYSTCSTSMEENEGVLSDFLTSRTDFMVEDLRELFPDLSSLFTQDGFFRSWPHRHGMDGFFAARLRKCR